MEAQRWKQIEALFEAVQAQPPENRMAFLAQACPDDPQLRGEVESLLAQKADSFLESAPASPAKALRPGSRLGNFEIVELLGRGGMGEVWRARDARLKRDVAIKVLPAALARDSDRISRFEREARAASALNHPNIVTVHDIGCDNGTYWIATELVRGETLRRMVEAGPVPAAKVIDIAAQVAAGLAAAHAAGLVHRDLKPDNIMVTRDGHVKILDFGLAKQWHMTADSTTADLTDEGMVLGTAGYMSPEQVRGEPIDHRSDLFSFGVVLYEMLCGKRAFAGGSSVEVMNAILTEEPPELLAPVPSALDRIARRCLEKDPNRRFQSAADLGFALEWTTRSGPAAVQSLRRRVWPAWVVAAACLAVAVAVYVRKVHFGPVGIAAGTTLRRLTTDNGLTTDAAISADGKFIAYASDRADSSNLDIWVQQIGGGGDARITNNPADDYDPSISPDGSQVAFRSERDGGGIYLMPALGGDARLLIPKGRRPRFSPDGSMLMYSVGSGDDFSGADLFVQRLSGGTPTQIGAGCSPYPVSAVWSPDGSCILFDGFCADNGYKGAGWVSTPDGRRIGKLDLFSFINDQWLPNPSRLLIPFHTFRAELSDEASISALPISTDGTKVTGPAERLTFGTGGERHASAANGLTALSVVNSENHVWGLPIDASGRGSGPPRQLTFGSAGESLCNLSKDGQKLAFTTHRTDHHQLFIKDLKTGKEQEIPWEGVRLSYAALAPDASKVVFTNYLNSRRDSSGFIYQVPVSGGFPRKIWGAPKTFYGVWDWSPDGTTILFFSHGVVEQLDLKSGSKTTFLEAKGYEVWQSHFSPDGRWVTFNAVKDGRSTLFVAPFRKGLVPRSDWIPIADSGWDDKPHFSANGKLIFFSSDRDGFRCIWAQLVGPDMHPVGAAFAVYHSHERRRSFRNLRNSSFEIAVGPDMVVFNQEERTGNIWLLEPAKKDTQ